MGELFEQRGRPYVAVCQKCNVLGVCVCLYFKDYGGFEVIICDMCIAMLTIKCLELKAKRNAEEVSR